MNKCSKTSALRVNRYQLCGVWGSPMPCNLDLQHVMGPGKGIVSSWAFCTPRAAAGSSAAWSGEILKAFTAVPIAAREAQPRGRLGEVAGLKLETTLLHSSVPRKSFGVLSTLPSGNLLQPRWPEQVSLGSLKQLPALLSSGRTGRVVLIQSSGCCERWCSPLRNEGSTADTHALSFRALQPPALSSLSRSVPVCVFAEPAISSLPTRQQKRIASVFDVLALASPRR